MRTNHVKPFKDGRSVAKEQRVKILGVNLATANPQEPSLRCLLEMNRPKGNQYAEILLVYDESAEKIVSYAFQVLNPGSFSKDDYPEESSVLDATDIAVLKRVMSELNKTFGSSFFLNFSNIRAREESEPQNQNPADDGKEGQHE